MMLSRNALIIWTIKGMFIVSLPYTVLHGGWWSIFALVWVAFICYYTGVILVECLYDDQGKRIRGSYKAVAEACWGKIWGGRLVFTAQITELLMTCILYVVLCGDLMENSFPDSSMDKMAWMMLSAAALLPCAFIKDLRVDAAPTQGRINRQHTLSDLQRESCDSVSISKC
ncbi:hypothetical protein M514_25848 [Trichuris suis]|uniref:Amino acid transporter transmembrane domain-containing protein n=1 Tax=Trichuris suis TaxID=68888 RepID=A0A085MXM5_9BILA|nr:hypothetical protein M514_25848 [Trichuris suis]